MRIIYPNIGESPHYNFQTLNRITDKTEKSTAIGCSWTLIGLGESLVIEYQKQFQQIQIYCLDDKKFFEHRALKGKN